MIKESVTMEKKKKKRGGREGQENNFFFFFKPPVKWVPKVWKKWRNEVTKYNCHIFIHCGETNNLAWASILWLNPKTPPPKRGM